MRALRAGTLEVVAEEMAVLNAVTCKLPFPVGGAYDEPPREELRLRHRVLDLRCGCTHVGAECRLGVDIFLHSMR